MKRNLSIEVERSYASDADSCSSCDLKGCCEDAGVAMLFAGSVFSVFGCFLIGSGICLVLLEGLEVAVLGFVSGYVCLVGSCVLFELRNNAPRFRWFHAALLATVIPIAAWVALAAKNAKAEDSMYIRVQVVPTESRGERLKPRLIGSMFTKGKINEWK